MQTVVTWIAGGIVIGGLVIVLTALALILLGKPPQNDQQG
jgi:hypothetical protein